MLVLIAGCSERKAYGEETNVDIIRFDKQLYTYLTQDDVQAYDRMDQVFLAELGEKVLKIGAIDSVGFYDRLRAYFSESTLMGLYADEQKDIVDISSIEKELSVGMNLLLEAFPLKRPRVYMHVSGLEQNVIVTDEILSLSADKYLGENYLLYQHFFYDYQRCLMTVDRMVPDYLLGFLMANYPFRGNPDVLLERMLYEGKLRYVLSLFLPERKEWESLAYSKEEFAWCLNNESSIWKAIVEHKHLYTPDQRVTMQYLNDAPYTTTLPNESPGRVGVWVGYRIVSAYMKRHKQCSPADLMALDAQTLLKGARYKP